LEYVIIYVIRELVAKLSKKCRTKESMSLPGSCVKTDFDHEIINREEVLISP